MISIVKMAHPNLFPTGRFGYEVKKNVPLAPTNTVQKMKFSIKDFSSKCDRIRSKYFNQGLSNYSRKFVSDSDYIFFAHAVIQKIQLNDQISIAMRKIVSYNLNAGMLSKNFKATVHQFIVQDKAYSFMSSFKCTPAYWKKYLFEVLVMINQLGIPTFFMTFSRADLRRNKLIGIISNLN